MIPVSLCFFLPWKLSLYKSRNNNFLSDPKYIIGAMESTDQRRNKADLNCSTAKRLCDSSVNFASKSANINHEESFGILYHYLLIVFIFMFFSTEYSIGESSKPLNRAAIKGEQVQLNCSTNDPYNGYWKYAKPSEREERLYDGIKVVNGFQTLYSVDDSKAGHFNLLFNSSYETSGTYVCQPEVNLSDQSAEVIVLDVQPICFNSLSSDVVHATCSMNFSGNWAPEIEWRFKNGKLEANDTVIIPNSRVSSFVTVSVSEVSYILACTPKFRIKGKPPDTTATNVPEYPNNCTLKIGGSSTEAPTIQPTSSHTPPPPQPPPLYIIGICVGISVCVATIVLIAMLYIRKKNRRKMLPAADVSLIRNGGDVHPSTSEKLCNLSSASLN